MGAPLDGAHDEAEAPMGFFRGVAAFVAGVGWVASTPRVWARAMVPVATALVLVFALGAAGIYASLKLAHRALGDGIEAGLAAMVLAIAAVILAVVVGVSLAQPLSGWALEGIVRAQERDLGIAPPEQRSGFESRFESAS